MQKQLNNGVQPPSVNVARVGRDVYLSGEINEDSIFELMKIFQEIENEDDEIGVQTNAEVTLNGIADSLGKEKGKINKDELKLVENIINDFRENNENPSSTDREPIHFHISSMGGDGFECLGIIDFIRNMKTPVWGYTYKAMSAGFFIFMACDKRIMYQNGILVYHQMQTATIGTLQDVIEDVSECMKMQERIEDLTLDCTNISQEKLDEVREKKIDWYIDSDLAINLGIADEII